MPSLKKDAERMERIMEKVNVYSTSDLYLAAFLKANGVRLFDKKRNGKRVEFLFKDRPDRAELIQAFFNDGNIGITTFKNAVQDLKTIVFNMQ